MLITAFDDTVYLFISNFISDSMTDIMKLITFLGSGWALVIISFLILCVNFVYRNKRFFIYSLMVPANLALGSLFNFILKQLFRRPRPDILKLIEIGGYSFPSGHSMSSMIFYGFIIYLVLKHLKHSYKHLIALILCLLILCIGISRIYLGVHYASDVAGGFVVGIGWLIIFIRTSKGISEKYI